MFNNRVSKIVLVVLFCLLLILIGKGIYSSFAIPKIPVASPLGASTMQKIPVAPPLGASSMPEMRGEEDARQAFAGWFLSKPIANAELVNTAERYNIENAKSDERENTTVDKGKSIGLPINLTTAGEDVTVIATISNIVLGKVDYSTIPVDYEQHRQWTATLYDSAGNIFEKRTTRGDILRFSISSWDNTGGQWRIRIDDTTGYFDKNIFATMIVKGERKDIDDGGW